MRKAICTLFTAVVLFTALTARADETLNDLLRKAGEPLIYALSLIGTPYKFGGGDPQTGLDCSGFVRHVYKQTADMDLPHNADGISRVGRSVEQTELRAGDLVFFKTLRKSISHVGIYAGEGKFVHATSHRGKEVKVSNLDENYWAKRFAGARRLLDGD